MEAILHEKNKSQKTFPWKKGIPTLFDCHFRFFLGAIPTPRTLMVGPLMVNTISSGLDQIHMIAIKTCKRTSLVN